MACNLLAGTKNNLAMSSHLKLVVSGPPDVRNDLTVKIPRVLLAEDDAEMRRIVGDALRKEGYEVLEANDGQQLLGLLVRDQRARTGRQATIDLILTDVRLPGCDGLDILELLRGTESQTPMIVMTAFGDRDTRARAKGLGAVMLDKPFRLDVLLMTIRTSLR